MNQAWMLYSVVDREEDGKGGSQRVKLQADSAVG